MAQAREQGASIFRQSAMGRMTSSDDLDKYIKVTNPSMWMVMLAVALLVVGLLVWSVAAIIPSTVHEIGFMRNDTVVCWVSESIARKMSESGFTASIGDVQASDVVMSDIPLSASEVRAALGSSYALDEMTLDDWNYEVTMGVSANPYSDKGATTVPVSITVLETHPLDLVFGNGQ